MAKPSHPSTRRVPKTRAQILALLAPRPKPVAPLTPEPPNLRPHTIRLLSTLLALVADIAERAHNVYLATRGSKDRKPDPYLPVQRATRAINRIVMLLQRLRDPKPLPGRTGPAPKSTQPAKPQAPATPPPKPAKLPRTRLSTYSIRRDVQRLLRTKTMPQIIALICRDLGLSPDPATWPSPKPPPPATPPKPAGGPPQSAIPPRRVDPHADPPRPPT